MYDDDSVFPDYPPQRLENMRKLSAAKLAHTDQDIAKVTETIMTHPTIVMDVVNRLNNRGVVSDEYFNRAERELVTLGAILFYNRILCENPEELAEKFK